MRYKGWWLLLIMMASPVSAGTAYLATATVRGALPVKTWKALRDERVVKQDLDYSCGAASVATILREYYRQPTATEQRILKAMHKDVAASFHDLSGVVKRYGLKGVGLALNFGQLKQLKMPAIAYLEYRGDAHFSVIRGISKEGRVWLGDPSWGNRRFSQQQFLATWETRQGNALKGKILLLLPAKRSLMPVDRAFFTAPENNALPEILLGLRP